MTNAKGKRIINTQSHWLRNRGRQGCLKKVYYQQNTLVSIPHITACSTFAALSDCRRAIRKLMLHWKNTCFAVRSADRLLSQMQIQKIQSVCSRETWWSHGGQVFAAKDIHEKEMSCERRRAWDGWYCVLGHRAPPLHTHAHPCLFAEGISCWNVTIAMQSVPQLPDVPIDVQGWEMQDVLAYVTVTTRLRNSK